MCTDLDKRKYDHLLQNENEEFVCHLCELKGENLKQELRGIKTQLSKIDNLQQTIEFMSNQFDGILKGIAENKTKLEVLQKENKNLRMELKEIKNSVKYLNDYKVRNDCLINGIVVGEEANAVQTIVKVMKDVGMELKENDIDIAYFLKENKNAKQKENYGGKV